MTKKFSELEIIDDYMFCKILVNNPNICKELLELILGFKIARIEISESQKVIDLSYESKGVRFDVYAADDKNKVYDIEMQTRLVRALTKRMRYYQGMIDLDNLGKGAEYYNLNDSFIIFICLTDPFGKNLPIYSFCNICEQDKTLKMNDGAHKIVVNASGDRNGLSDEMCAFLDYLKTKRVGSPFTERLQTAIEIAKAQREWEVEYMTLAMKIKEERIQGFVQSAILFNIMHDDIIAKLMSEFELTKDQAEEILLECSEQ